MQSMNTKVPVLYIDIEGGWGGSSRSLYYLIKHLDRARYAPVVVYGKEGPNRKRYFEMGVPAYLFSPLPRVRALRRNNHKALLLFVLKLVHLPRFLLFVGRLVKKYRIKLIHLNEESLFFVAIFFKMLFDCKIVYHIRTMLPPNIFGKIQVRLASGTADSIIFITENEQKRWHELCPRIKDIPQSVIYNFAEAIPINRPRILSDYGNRFRIAVMSTMSPARGIDRVISVAESLRRRNHRESLFVVCGQEGRANSYASSLRQNIKDKQLEDFFLFLGHQEMPEAVISECSALIHLTRDYNPWGRNVIEAIVCGKPVISIGTYNKFIENNVNGYLLPEFDAEAVSDKIMFLYSHPEVLQDMEKVNADKGKRLFGPSSNVSKIAGIYDFLLRKRNHDE